MRICTVPAAKAVLLARVEAAVATVTPPTWAEVVVVEWGLPVEAAPARRNVYLARSVNYSRPSARGTYRVETYGLELVIEVLGVGRKHSDAKETEEAMWALIGAIERNIIPDRSLEVADVIEVVPSDPLVYGYQEGFIARDSVRVDVEAVL